MKEWVQDRESGELIPKDEYLARGGASKRGAAHVQKDLEPFVSPVDGTTIFTKRQLRDHNKKHGVTDQRDYGPNWFKRKEQERANASKSKQSKQERVEAIKQSMYRHGVLD